MPYSNWSPLLISVATTCSATVVTFFLGLLAARKMYGLRTRWRAWIDGILTLPLVLPPTVVGFFLLLIFGRRSLLGHALEQVGVTIAFSWPATVIAATVVAFPLMYRTTLGAFEQVNPKLLEAARTLGASEWRVFSRVLLPLAGPGVLAGTVLAFARAMGEFGATLMLAGNIPGRTQTMPVAIFSAAEGGDMHAALAWVCIIVLLSLGIIRLLHYERKTRAVTAADAVEPGDAPKVSAPYPRTVAKRGDALLEAAVERRFDGFTLCTAVRAGDGTVGLLGPSGSGKSMTLRMIAGISTPERGRIVLNGRVLFDSATGVNVAAAKRRVGFVFQDYALFPHMTVAENVGFGLQALPGAERRERVEQLLATMGLRELARRYPRGLSGGQAQRVALARSMAMKPDALLLDEPFAALDPHLRRQTEEHMRETLAAYDGVVIFVTHDMEEAFRFCGELVVLAEGKVIASRPRQDLFDRPGTVTAARLTGCKNIAAASLNAAGNIDVAVWKCELKTSKVLPAELTHVGYRSHHFVFGREAGATNTFPCWLVSTSEAPHEMTLYLHLHAEPEAGAKAHVQADLPKDAWLRLSAQPQPWQITLDADRVLLLED
ncbi:MAG: molybdate ABC transporter permease subunit [Terracidiphilus sp.]|nr:molybdate ABC transporter permease subunit [Terracidiphilus sp.]